MKKRSSRVYVLLIVLSVIMFFSFIIDMTVPKPEQNTDSEQADTVMNNDNFDSDENMSEENTEVTTEFVEETTRLLTASEQTKVNNFYKNTVFVGDSIMLGFSTYSLKSEAPEFVKNLTFLAAASYGINAAISGGTLIYEGEGRTLIENLEIIQPEKIFINLGVNELDGVPAEKVGEKYEKLIESIHNALPEARVYILGSTYFVEGKETDTYNNGGIKEFNKYLSSHSEEWSVTYLPLGDRLANNKGYLPAEYSSDGRIHHNDRAYRVWVNFLEDFALGNIR